MTRQLGRFEAGRELLPKEAAWLAEFDGELLAFLGRRYDDQVDALLLFLDWLTMFGRTYVSLEGIRIPRLRRDGEWID